MYKLYLQWMKTLSQNRVLAGLSGVYLVSIRSPWIQIEPHFRQPVPSEAKNLDAVGWLKGSDGRLEPRVMGLARSLARSWLVLGSFLALAWEILACPDPSNPGTDGLTLPATERLSWTNPIELPRALVVE